MKGLISRIAELPKPWLAALAAVSALAVVGASWATVAVISDDPSSVDQSPSPPPASPSPTASAEPPEDTSGGGGNINNEVVLINRQDERKYTRAGLGMARVTGDTANNKNAAAAFSSCIRCRTVAVAVQIVLIMGDVKEARPQNLAIAMNQNCQGCVTAAFAYQYVITTRSLVRFTAQGQTKIADLRAQISDATGSDLDPFAVEAKLDGLVDQLWAVVDQELVAVDAMKVPKKAKDIATSPDSPVATPFPSVEPSPTPQSPAPEPSPQPSPSEEPSPTPSASPSS